MSAFEGCIQGSVLVWPTQPSLISLAWGCTKPAHLFLQHLSPGLLPRQDSEYRPVPRSFLRVWPQAPSSSEKVLEPLGRASSTMLQQDCSSAPAYTGRRGEWSGCTSHSPAVRVTRKTNSHFDRTGLSHQGFSEVAS